MSCAVTRIRSPAFRTLPSRTLVTPRAAAIRRTSSMLAFEGERGSARDHPQIRDFRQEVDDLLGKAVAEILVLLVAAHIVEGKDRDRRLRVRGAVHLSTTSLERRPSTRASTRTAGRAAWPGIAARSARAGWCCSRGGGSSRNTALRISAAVSPPKARVPESISYRTAPKLKTSERASSDLPSRLFRRHVRGRARDGALDRARDILLRRHDLRQAEVEHLRAAVGRDQDVGRLEIAMEDALLMCRV